MSREHVPGNQIVQDSIKILSRKSERLKLREILFFLEACRFLLGLSTQTTVNIHDVSQLHLSVTCDICLVQYYWYLNVDLCDPATRLDQCFQWNCQRISVFITGDTGTIYAGTGSCITPTAEHPLTMYLGSVYSDFITTTRHCTIPQNTKHNILFSYFNACFVEDKIMCMS